MLRFVLGFIAAHFFWATVLTLWYLRMARLADKQGREVLNENFKMVRDSIRQRRAPRN